MALPGAQTERRGGAGPVGGLLGGKDPTGRLSKRSLVNPWNETAGGTGCLITAESRDSSTTRMGFFVDAWPPYAVIMAWGVP